MSGDYYIVELTREGKPLLSTDSQFLISSRVAFMFSSQQNINAFLAELEVYFPGLYSGKTVERMSVAEVSKYCIENEVLLYPEPRVEVNFDGKYAVQIRGMWKTNSLSMGGSFVGYVVVDEKLKRLYYIEGFLYAPGRNQREYLRELDVILRTFKTSEEIS